MKVTRLLALVASALIASAHAQRLVVNGDEWTLWNAGASQIGTANFNRLAANLKSYLDAAGKAGCSFLDMGGVAITESAFAAQMAVSPACSYARDASAPFTLGNLQNYDAVFLGGPISGAATGADVAAVLLPYIAAGGNVYIAGGTGAWGNPVDEANYWNPTLNALGLSMIAEWPAATGSLGAPVASSHPVLAGVGELYFHFANPLASAGTQTGSQIVLAGGHAGLGPSVGLMGVYDRAMDERVNPRMIPTNSTEALVWLALALAALVVQARYRRPGRP